MSQKFKILSALFFSLALFYFLNFAFAQEGEEIFPTAFYNVNVQLVDVDTQMPISFAGLKILVQNESGILQDACFASGGHCSVSLPAGEYQVLNKDIFFNCSEPDCPLKFQVIDKAVALQLKIKFIIPQMDYCSDSDRTGDSYFTKGAVKFYKKGYNFMTGMVDSCITKSKVAHVREYSCSVNIYNVDDYQCPNGCYNGACLQSCATLFGSTDLQCKVPTEMEAFRQQCPGKKVAYEKLAVGQYCSKIGGNYCIQCKPECETDNDCKDSQCQVGEEPFCSSIQRCACRKVVPIEQRACSICGEGLFNICHKDDCGLLSGGNCIFFKKYLGLGNKCFTKTECDNYCKSQALNYVCGDNGRTYKNECMARCDKQEVAYSGQCKQLVYCDSLYGTGWWCGTEKDKTVQCGQGIGSLQLLLGNQTCDKIAFAQSCVTCAITKCSANAVSICHNFPCPTKQKPQCIDARCVCKDVVVPPITINCQKEYGQGYFCATYSEYLNKCKDYFTPAIKAQFLGSAICDTIGQKACGICDSTKCLEDKNCFNITCKDNLKPFCKDSICQCKDVVVPPKLLPDLTVIGTSFACPGTSYNTGDLISKCSITIKNQGTVATAIAPKTNLYDVTGSTWKQLNQITHSAVLGQNGSAPITFGNFSFATAGTYKLQACVDYKTNEITESNENNNCSDVLSVEVKALQLTCSDGTFYGQCSVNKPKYCDNGNLVDKASLCGCPLAFEVYENQCTKKLSQNCGTIYEGTKDYSKAINFIIVPADSSYGNLLNDPNAQYSNNLDAFIADSRKNVNNFLSIDPIDKYKSIFNFYYSNDIIKCTLPGDRIICNLWKEAADNCNIPYDEVIILQRKEGGGLWGGPWIQSSSLTSITFAHEIGHYLGLFDYDDIGLPAGPNFCTSLDCCGGTLCQFKSRSEQRPIELGGPDCCLYRGTAQNTSFYISNEQSVMGYDIDYKAFKFNRLEKTYLNELFATISSSGKESVRCGVFFRTKKYCSQIVLPELINCQTKYGVEYKCNTYSNWSKECLSLGKSGEEIKLDSPCDSLGNKSCFSCKEKPVVVPITGKEGLIIVKKGSVLENKSAEVAKTKGWYFKAIDSSDPVRIRQEIQGMYSQSKFNYLLIMGDENEISIQDFTHVLPGENKNPVTDANPVPILDSYYYGTMGDLNNSFVTLSVGRLPFNDPKYIDQYYASLNQKGEPFAGFYRFSETDPNDNNDAFTGFDYSWYSGCMEGRFPSLNVFKKSTKNEFVENLKKASIFSVKTHGSPMGVSLNYGEDPFGGIPTIMNSDMASLRMSATSPIFAALSCNAAQVLGKEVLKNGAGAFLGNYNLSGSETHTIIELLLKGYSVGDAVKDQINRQFLARTAMTYNVNDSYGTQGIQNIDLKVKPYIVKSNKPTYRDGFGFILYGDPSFRKNNIQTVPDSSAITQENNKIVVVMNLPKSIPVNNTAKTKLLCYNTQDQIGNNYDWGTHQVVLISEVKDVNKIENVQIYKNDVKMDETTAKALVNSSTFMLVKDSNGKEYIVIAFENEKVNKNDKLKFVIDYNSLTSGSVSATKDFTITLLPGINLISSPMEESLTYETIKKFCPVDENYPGFIKYSSAEQKAGFFYSVSPYEGANVVIKEQSSGCQVLLKGNSFVFQSKALKKGWNLISIGGAANAVKGNCKIEKISGYNEKMQPQDYGLNDQLDKTKGYWVKVGNDCVLSSQ